MKNENIYANPVTTSAGGKKSSLRPVAAAAGAMMAVYSMSAYAFDIETSNKDVKIRWDNTFKYSAAARLKDQSVELVADPNQDDGDRNFKKGLISNRLDWLTELDISHQNIGMRLSGAGWYDTVYHRGTDHDSPATASAFSAGPNSFTQSTKKLHGEKAELLDAFVYGRFTLGDMPLTARVGKHTLIYGETLFFGANGIAAAQGPIDVIKLLSVPNSQFKELLMPVEQVSGQLQLNSNLSLGGYYQFGWKRTRLPGAGSYFSSLDMLDAGGERFFVGPGPALFRGPDIEAKNSGQGGVQLRFRPSGSDVEYGLYAARYHDKTPQIYAVPGAGFNPATGQVGQFRLVFPEGVKTVGVTASTVLADANVAAELSFRSNMPLVSNVQTDLTGTADNSGAGLYAVGKTAHLNVSAIYSAGKSSMFDNAILTAELGFNRLLSISRNPAALDPNTVRNAWGVRMIFEPSYYQVLPGLDLAVPIGLGYNPAGNSAVVGAFNGGADNGGDLSIGVKGTYLGNWKIGVNYTHFLGSAKTTLDPVKGYQFSFGQALKDRDYISLSLQTAF